MFVVPIKGDVVTTEGGVPRTVLSYAPYKEKPAVYVEGQGANTESILFTEIESINSTPVTLNGSKVFVANSKIKRKFDLPQVNDKIVVSGKLLKVKGLKLSERGSLTGGMLVICEDPDTKDRLNVRLATVSGIERANGSKQRTDLSAYSEYLGVR